MPEETPTRCSSTVAGTATASSTMATPHGGRPSLAESPIPTAATKITTSRSPWSSPLVRVEGNEHLVEIAQRRVGTVADTLHQPVRVHELGRGAKNAIHSVASAPPSTARAQPHQGRTRTGASANARTSAASPSRRGSSRRSHMPATTADGMTAASSGPSLGTCPPLDVVAEHAGEVVAASHHRHGHSGSGEAQQPRLRYAAALRSGSSRRRTRSRAGEVVEQQPVDCLRCEGGDDEEQLPALFTAGSRTSARAAALRRPRRLPEPRMPRPSRLRAT